MKHADGGQAVVVVVLLVALAAAAIVGLAQTQERILDQVRDERAGEGAVEAAGAVVADALASGQESAAVAADPRVLARAGIAANEIARWSGRAAPHSLRLTVAGGGVDVSLVLAGQAHRASVSLGGIPCCRR